MLPQIGPRQAEGFNAETVRMNTHTGTHVDVPYHFDEDGAKVDEMPLSAFAGPAAFLDLRDRLEPSQAIEAAELEGVVDAVLVPWRTLYACLQSSGVGIYPSGRTGGGQPSGLAKE